MAIPWLTLITFLPVLGSIIVLFLPSDRAIKTFSIAWSLIPLVLSIVVWVIFSTWPGGTFPLIAGCAADPNMANAGPNIINASAPFFLNECYQWIPAIGVNYHVAVDGISVPLVFLTTLLTTVGLYYSARVIHDRVREYFFLFLLLETGMLGVFVAFDLFLFFVFWEIGLVPMYFLIGIWGHDEDRPQYAAIKFFLYTLVGSALMLLSIIAIYLNTGTFDLAVVLQQHPFLQDYFLATLAFFGFWLAFSIKVPLWPFHTWLPDAHTAAPTAGSVVLAGVLLKLGTYGYLRMLMGIFPQVFRDWAIPIGVLAVISIVYGAFVAMAQRDFKRLVAYSSVNHMGYVILGLAAAAALTPNVLKDANALNSAATAVNGAVMEMFNHGIITGALFFVVGMLYERAHTRDLTQFGGLGAKVPVYAALLLLFAFASLGLPGLAGFVGEFLVFRGAYAALTPMTFIAIIGIVITAAFFLWKVIQRILLGSPNPAWAGLTDLHSYEVITLVPLAILTILIGLYPQWIINTINTASVAILQMIGGVSGG